LHGVKYNTISHKWHDGSRAFFSGEISPDVSESDESAVVPPKFGQCKASRGDTGPKKKPWTGDIARTS